MLAAMTSTVGSCEMSRLDVRMVLSPAGASPQGDLEPAYRARQAASRSETLKPGPYLVAAVAEQPLRGAPSNLAPPKGLLPARLARACGLGQGTRTLLRIVVES